MMYKPSELVEELGIPLNHIYRVYIPLGCPHERDTRRYILINGKEFQRWYLETYKKVPSPAGHGHCGTCKENVLMLSPERNEKDGLVYDLGLCPNCGRKVSRIITQKVRK